ncbi:hypothetical protein [Micromonospora chalcea]|uniref:hypothetical protein n=1 Tax=Micromonospora chalcea TaxID=1874 RepID=UPI001C703775|nr:hypothetical protein [Micromonospora chalcea]
MWDYDSGHAKLLLRGFPDPEHEFSEEPGVVDVVFTGVRHVVLESAYPELTVARAGSAGLGEAWRDYVAQREDLTVYQVEGGIATGYVVADRVNWGHLSIPGGQASPIMREDREMLEWCSDGTIFWL